MIKSFTEFVKENNMFNAHYQDDDYSIMDKTFLDIDLSNVPIDKLKKQYVNFKSLIKLPPTIGDPLFEPYKKAILTEGVKETIDIEDAKKAIMDKYWLEDWQFEMREAQNNIKIALIIPKIRLNVEMVIEDMLSMGYYECDRFILDIERMSYVVIRFDPRYPKDITNLVRKMKYIKHLTPKYNLNSIQTQGFIPSSKNEKFNYPSRIHFLKENINYENINFLGYQLCKTNNNPKNNGEYVLFTLDVSKIPDGVSFVGDSCYEYGICTEDKIPFDTVIDIQEIKFQK